MKALFCHDNYYIHTPHAVYSEAQFPYSAWSRYLRVFDDIEVLGREKPYDPDHDYGGYNIASGDHITIHALPNINSLKGRLCNRKKAKQKIANIIDNNAIDAIIMRGISEYGILAFQIAKRRALPVALEMSGCTWDNLWHYGSLAGKIYAPLRYLTGRKIAAAADFAIYVTEHWLQGRYPSGGVSEFASNVEITMPDDHVLDARMERIEKEKPELTFGLIGAVDHDLKGIHTAIEALVIAKDKLPPCRLRILGKGNPEKWVTLAQKLGVSDIVQFDGTLPSGNAVLDWLDHIDVYLQPSFHEGLPRATIEAMSRACPAIGSNAGGIPELIQPEWIHHKGDAARLATLMIRMANNPENQQKQAKLNFERSKNYTSDILIPRRNQFWNDFAKLAKLRKKERIDG